MTYTYGKDHIVKHKYGVYIRNYPTTADITDMSYAPRISDIVDATLTKQQNLYRLAAVCNHPGGMNSIVAGTGIDADIDTNYAWYRMTLAGAAAIDLDNETIAGAIDGDIMVIEHYSGEFAFTVTDVDEVEVDIGHIGDIAVFVFDTTWKFWFYAAEGSGTAKSGDILYYYTKIGVCDAGPSVKTAEGDTRDTATLGEIQVSETIEVNATVLEVTKDNWEFLRTWSANEMDVIFYDEGNVQDGIGIENVAMQANLEATGNDLNTIPIMLKKECSNVDDIFQFTYVGV